MDFSRLSEYLVTRTFEAKDPAGNVVDSCEVTYDVNKYSGELDRRMGALYAGRVRELDTALKVRAAQPSTNGTKKRKKAGTQQDDSLTKLADDFQESKELDAKLADLRKELLADSLASDRYGLIRAWGMDRQTGQGQTEPVPPTFENMMRLPTGALEDLLALGRDAERPKGQAGETPMAGRSTGRRKTTSETSDSTTPAKSTTPPHEELVN